MVDVVRTENKEASPCDGVDRVTDVEAASLGHGQENLHLVVKMETVFVGALAAEEADLYGRFLPFRQSAETWNIDDTGVPESVIITILHF